MQTFINIELIGHLDHPIWGVPLLLMYISGLFEKNKKYYTPFILDLLTKEIQTFPPKSSL